MEMRFWSNWWRAISVALTQEGGKFQKTQMSLCPWEMMRVDIDFCFLFL